MGMRTTVNIDNMKYIILTLCHSLKFKRRKLDLSILLLFLKIMKILNYLMGKKYIEGHFAL